MYNYNGYGQYRVSFFLGENINVVVDVVMLNYYFN